jgi:hypothetical protein
MTKLFRFLALSLALATLWLPARAADSLSAEEKAAVVGVITSQLQAFAADEGAAAYSHAAPIVKMAFPNVETFMRMVEKGYQPVYRNQGYEFGESFTDNLGRPTQRVVITAVDGKRYEAIYAMEKQQDGTWKIAGCMLLMLPGTEV